MDDLVVTNDVLEVLNAELTSVQEDIMSCRISYEDRTTKLKLFDVLQRIESLKNNLVGR